MANANFTGHSAPAGFDAFPKSLLSMPEIEKKSCSLRGVLIHPLELMGKRIRFAELMLSQVGLFEGDAFESAISFGTVLAVNLGSIAHGIQTSLLIQEDGFAPYYSDVSDLTVLEVLPDRIAQSDSGAGLSGAAAGTATDSRPLASSLAQDQQPARTTVIGITTRADFY